MSIEKTILKYQKQGIRLFLENGKLCYNSPKGVMNKAIQEELSKIRDELIDFLAKSCSPVIIDKENLNEEFDLTNMQLAYTVGKGELYKYGQTNCKIYCEIKYPVIDIAKFKKSWTDVIIANEMLHAVIYNDGKQKILKDYNIPDIRYTKRCSKYHFNDEHLENVRKRLSSKTYELGKWPLYDIEITSFDDYSIIHLSLDMLIADFTSIGVIIRDLEDSYFEDIKLENKGITFRDIIVFDENFKKTSEYRINYNKAKDYWLKKIEDLPEGPTLTTKSSEGNVSIKQFNLRITEKRELEIQDICSRNKITLTAFILTAYAEVLSRWSSEKRFCINVTISERDDIHPNISSIVGDFTDINLLEISNLNENEFVENAQNIQLQLWKDIDNRSFSGIEVLREVSKSRKQNIIYPYVFTSALGIQENIKSNSISNFGELVYKITQTPQVILDCQVMRDKGGILITWDVRDNIFPKGMIESAFTRFSDIILNRRKENSSKDKEVLGTFGQSHILSSEFNDNMNFESFIGNLYLEEMASKIILNNYDQKYTYKKLGLLVRNIRDLLIINKCKSGDTVLINSPDAFLKVGAILAILSIGGGALPIDETEDLEEIESLNKKYDIKFALINDIDDFCLDGEIYKNLKIISLEQIEDFDDEKPDKFEITDIAKATLISKEMDQLGEMRFYPIKVKNIFSFVRKQIDLLKVRKADELLVCENNNSRVLITNLLICLLSQSTLNLCKNISQQKYNKMIMDSEFIQVNMHQLEVLCKNHIRKSKIKSIISKTLIVITAIDSMSLINQFPELLESFRIIFMIDDFTIQDNEQYMILCKEYVKMDHEDNLLSFNKNLSSGEISILDQHLSMCPEWVVGDIFVNKKSNDESSSDIYNSTDQKNVLAKTKFRGMYTSDSIIVTHDSTGDVKLEGNDINVYEIESKINSLKDIHKSAIVPNKNDCSVDVFVQPNFSEATKDTRNIKFSEFNIKDVDDFNLDNFLRWMQASNETAIEDIFQTFLKLGVFVNKNKWYSIKEIYYETKVVDIYKRLLKRWLNALISEGIIKYNANRGYKLNSCRVDNIGKA
ncbi:condensation domain-containing protein [Streptococcus anginosus]|nr:condensation domain-containing protein [Streptococcus anginosus]MED5904815.1 condensation domain-containing protein [Streptococcus anginosus]